MVRLIEIGPEAREALPALENLAAEEGDEKIRGMAALAAAAIRGKAPQNEDKYRPPARGFN
jgi:hypothetical protein